jgi:hypothetical protein
MVEVALRNLVDRLKEWSFEIGDPMSSIDVSESMDVLLLSSTGVPKVAQTELEKDNIFSLRSGFLGSGLASGRVWVYTWYG